MGKGLLIGIVALILVVAIFLFVGFSGDDETTQIGSSDQESGEGSSETGLVEEKESGGDDGSSGGSSGGGDSGGSSGEVDCGNAPNVEYYKAGFDPNKNYGADVERLWGCMSDKFIDCVPAKAAHGSAVFRIIEETDGKCMISGPSKQIVGVDVVDVDVTCSFSKKARSMGYTDTQLLLPIVRHIQAYSVIQLVAAGGGDLTFEDGGVETVDCA